MKVSVVGLGADESKKTFGVDLNAKHILPIWIKVENNDPEHAYFFLERSVDPDYYTAGEVAYISQFHVGYRLPRSIFPGFLIGILRTVFLPVENLFMGSANDKMRTEFQKQALKYGWIEPRETRAGFVFVPLTLGTKEIFVDLYRDDIKTGGDTRKNFNFFITIPGIKQDYRTKEFDKYYLPDQIIDIQETSVLMKTLEALPCCVTNRKGTKNGDPVNLVVIGTLDEMLESFTASKWDETEVIYLSSVWKMITSFSFKKKYDYSPVSPLYLYGRSQDIAFQKARATIDERMHARLWYSPLHFRGKPVWVGQVSRDIGVRFTHKTWNLMTHKIDPDIDESAVYTLTDLLYWHRIAEYGIIGGVPVSSEDKPAFNLTGDPYYTTGKRMVMLLSKTRHSDFPDKMNP